MPCKGKFFHKWTEWALEPGECKEVRRCADCGKQEERTISHNFSEWNYLSDNACFQYRVCIRCGYREEREKHTFQDSWHYIKSNSCTKVCQCRRCQKFKVHYDCHDFGEWQYINAHSCEQIRCCKRCGKIECRMAEHHWSQKINTYDECVQEANLLLLDARREYDESIKAMMSRGADEKSLANVHNKIDALKQQEVEHKLALQKDDDNCLGSFCTRCGAVKNLGIQINRLNDIVEE